MRILRSNPYAPGYRGFAPGRIMRPPFIPAKTSRPKRVVNLISPAAALVLVFLLVAGLGCSSDKRQVEDVALQWIEGIRNGDAETFERIIDWELWYSVSGGGTAGDQGGAKQTRKPPAGLKPEGDLTEDQEYQKRLLISVLSGDRIIASQYLTAEHKIKRVLVDGSEALIEISQVDRTTTDKRLVVLQMHKDPVAGWRIYKFRMEELKEV